ncbi:retrovirus-related pol polyprotein from transposon TNT 1-94, partial [Tanacetum coccineum]
VRVAVKVERGGSGCCRSWWWGKGDDGDVAVKMVIVAAVGGFRGGDDDVTTVEEGGDCGGDGCSDEGDEDGLIEKLINIKEIVEWPVELPDGRMVMANKEGNILFNSGFILKNDRSSRTVIGAGKRWDGGLFYFREKPLVQALNTTSSISVDLWHKRLGHPSLEDINFLPGVSSSRKDRVLSENCEVCHRAKQYNVSSSSQSPVKETTESPHEEELGRGCRKKETSVLLITEYLVNISKRHALWSLNEDILKITILKTNTPYPSRKIWRIRACTHQRPQRKQDLYAVSRRPIHHIGNIEGEYSG